MLEVAREGGWEEGRGRAETLWCRGVGCGGEGREGEGMRHKYRMNICTHTHRHT